MPQSPYGVNGGCADCYFGGVCITNRGPEDSPFVIVGESPGVMEIHYRKPFVGDSGKVLDGTLCKIFGLPKDTPSDKFPIVPYYTNAIQCLPRKKSPENLAAACIECRDRLLADIRKHPRKIILAVGNGALWSLTANFNLKITKERGKLFQSDLASIGIVATVHPAYLLYGGGNYKQFETDLKYATELYERGNDARRLPNGSTFRVVESPEEAYKFGQEIQGLPEGTVVATDIETTGFNHVTDRILEVGFQHDPKEIVIVPRKYLLPSHFSDRTNQVWHNGKFDCRFLHQRGCFKARVDDDTMLMSYALNERRGIHDLDQVASDWLGSPNHKAMVSEFYKGTVIDAVTGKKRQRNLGDAPLELRYRYLALDLADTFQLHHVMKPKVMEDPNLRLFYADHLLKASRYLLRVEQNGMLVDKTWVDSNSERLQREMEEYETSLAIAAEESGFGGINIRSPIQLKDFLYGHLKLAPISWSTDDDTLDKLQALHEGNKIIKTIKGYRTVAKSYTTYVRPLHPVGTTRINPQGKEVEIKSYLYPDYRVHQTYKIHGTATSRLSCADPNTQNIPRDPLLRGMFIARKGYGILEVDYSQAELRSLACLSQCPDLMEIFLSGKDLHVELSIFLFGANFTKEDKMKAKSVNFGIVYGRTAPSIADAFDVSIAEAQSWIDGWFRRFPRAAQYIEECRMAPVRGQTIITCFGNKKRPGIVNREKLRDIQNESANFPHQSIASNLTVKAGGELFHRLARWDVHIINTVHDCIVMEVPLWAPLIKSVSRYVVHTMEEIPTRYPGLRAVPFKAEPEFGLRWGNLLKFGEIESQYNWQLERIPDYVPAH